MTVDEVGIWICSELDCIYFLDVFEQCFAHPVHTIHDPSLCVKNDWEG